MPRQIGAKVHGAWTFEVGDTRTAKIDQFRFERGSGVVHIERVHDGLHRLAEFLVRHADYRCIQHLGMA